MLSSDNGMRICEVYSTNCVQTARNTDRAQLWPVLK